MKKFILISAIVLLSVVSKATDCIITQCPSNYGCKFMVCAPENYQICFKDSTFFTHAYGSAQLTFAAAQHEFDSLYIILAASEITKWGDVYVPSIPANQKLTNKDYLFQGAYRKFL